MDKWVIWLQLLISELVVFNIIMSSMLIKLKRINVYLGNLFTKSSVRLNIGVIE